MHLTNGEPLEIYPPIAPEDELDNASMLRLRMNLTAFVYHACQLQPRWTSSSYGKIVQYFK